MAQIVDIDNDDTIEKADIDAIIDKESPCFIIPVFFIKMCIRDSNSPILYCSARKGIASTEPEIPGTDLSPLFDAIIEHIPAPMADPDQPLQLLVSSVDYNNFVGRIGIGRVDRGVIKPGQQVMITNYHDPDSSYQGKINTCLLYTSRQSGGNSHKRNDG